ncbi:MAG: response regulator [Ruminococcus sp.]|nr:response regulator [Ruminococcus sp.]
MKKELRHNYIFLFLILFCFLFVSWMLLNYSVNLVDESADREGLSHIMENTEQLKYSLTSRVDDTLTIMEIERQSLDESENDSKAEIARKLSLMCEKTGAWRVYLISDKEHYLDDKGNTGRWEITDDMIPVLQGEKSICRLRQDAIGGDRLNFAIHLGTEVTDEKYEVLLVEYLLDKFLEVLEIKVHGGKGIACVVDSNGRILFRSQGEVPVFSEENYFFYQSFREMEFEGLDGVTNEKELRNAINCAECGAVYISDDDYAYAMSFCPLKIMDWHLVMLVEREYISGIRMTYIEQIKKITVTANLVVVILCLGIYFINTFLIRKRSVVQLSTRERIINVLSTDSNGAYLLVNSGSGICSFASESISEMFGISADTLIEKKLDALFESIAVPELVSRLKIWDQKEKLETDRFLFRSPKIEKEKYIRLSLYPPKHDEIVLAFVDETLIANKEKVLECALNEAHLANQAKSNFLSNMSHDIRTPMNAVIGYTTLALNNVNDSHKVEDYLTKTLSSGNHLLSLINDVLDMSSIECNMFVLEEQETKLSDILNDIKNIIGGQISEKNLNFSIKTSGVSDDNVYCDKTRLNQVLINLLGNAIKFTPEGGTISVELSQISGVCAGKSTYELKVRDTGIGMNKDFVDKIFEPFEREHSSTISGTQGTGLGMPITKNIIDMMGGTIDVYTEPEKGTEFIIRLELKICSEYTIITENEEIDPDALSELMGCHILIVEDNELNREIAEIILDDCGIRTDTAENGAEAVDKVINSVSDPFDVILMDIQMPVLDGYEATRRIRALDDPSLSSLPVLAMTADAFKEDVERCFAAGMDGHISKPIDVELLKKALIAAVRKKRESQ